MRIGLLAFSVVFAVAAYREAQRFERQYGRTPWGWNAWVWAVVMFLSWLIGLVLLAVAERQGRRHPAASNPGIYGTTAQYAPGYPTGAVVPAAAPTPALPPAHWATDPTGRYQYRWWDGTAWTPNVATNGMNAVDAI